MTAPSCSRCGADYPPGASPAGLCPACLLTAALSEATDTGDQGTEGQASLPPGAEVGPFRILGLLGRGGMAAVYQAFDARLERATALKVLPPEFAYDRAFARRFEQEARVIARLEHPNIVPIYATGIDDGVPWMSMRLMTGGNLATLLEIQRPGSLDAVRMLRNIADALDYAHARGVVHRDIKPSNLLLDDSNRVCVADFGLAQILESDDRMTRTGGLIGTPHYMSPERALGEAVDHRCDVYSLGVVAYEMFAGTVPFADDPPIAVLLKHVNQPLPAPPDGLLSRALLGTIQKATAKDPAERWSSAGAFVSAVEVALGVALPTSGIDPTEPRHRVISGRRLNWAGFSAVGAVVVVGLAWWTATSPATPEPPTEPAAVQQPASVERPVQAFPPAEAVTGEAPARPLTAAADRSGPQQDSAPRVNTASSQPTEEPPSLLSVEPREPTALTPIVPAAETVADDIAPSQAQPVPQPAPAVPSPEPLAELAPAPVPRPTESGFEAMRDVVVTPPQRRRAVNPDYPAAARAAELEGDVLLEAMVGVDGAVREISVLQSVHPLLDEAAKTAVMQYEYTPGRRNGVPAPATVRIVVSFRLQ